MCVLMVLSDGYAHLVSKAYPLIFQEEKQRKIGINANANSYVEAIII